MNNSESLTKHLKFPDRLIKLSYSKHATSRLVERTTGSLILAPHYIRLTKDNTTEIKSKGNRVIGATVFLEYKRGVYMYLPLVVHNGLVKTVYFKNVKKNTFKERNRVKENPILPKEAFLPENTGGENQGAGRFAEDVVHVSRDMGRKEDWREKLLRIIRSISWKRAKKYPF